MSSKKLGTVTIKDENVKRVEIWAKVLRKDGTIEDLGLVALYDKEDASVGASDDAGDGGERDGNTSQ